MRLFIAVNPPEHERRSLHQALAPFREAKLPLKHCAADNLHITLKFLGPVADDRAAAIADSLAQNVKGARSFDLALGGFGTFPDGSDPRIFWLGVERHPALELLANDVERAVSRHGFEPELRPFSPHLTVARAAKDARAAETRAAADALAALWYESVFAVESVDLMSSTTGPSGPVYRVVQRAALAGG